VGHSTLDKWIREANPADSSKRQLLPEHEQYIAQDSRFRKRGQTTQGS
jgi:hypothetical protein